MKKKSYLSIFILASIVFISATVSCSISNSGLTAATSSKTSIENNTEKPMAEETQETMAAESAIEVALEDPKDVSFVDIAQLAAVFAITNGTGSQLITFYSEAEEEILKGLNGAIGKKGQISEVKYLGKQESNAQDSARVISENFDNMEGYLFDSLGSSLISNDTYYLYNTEVMQKEHLLTEIGTGTVALDEEDKIKIAELKGRAVMQGWSISQYDDGTQVWIIVFEPQGNNLLMSIVLKTNDSIKVMDYPVESDGQSAWRVDDEGTIDPALFSILFALKTNEGLLITICWAGAEGENVFFLLEQEDMLKQLPSQIYRYWSPQ